MQSSSSTQVPNTTAEANSYCTVFYDAMTQTPHSTMPNHTNINIEPTINSSSTTTDSSTTFDHCNDNHVRSSNNCKSPTLSHHSSPLSPSPSRVRAQLSRESHLSTTCIVCMDKEKDITFMPCQHSQCCLSCFQRSGVHNCPICRSPVVSVIGFKTGLHLPVSLAAPSHRHRSMEFHPNRRAEERLQSDSVTNIASRRSLPTLRFESEFDAYSPRTRTASMSSMNIVTQAESSVRSLSRSQDAGLRHLREMGSTRNESIIEFSDILPTNRRATITSTDSFSSIGVQPYSSRLNSERQNVVLIGPSRKILVSLAQRLISVFPPPGSLKNSPLSKSTLYINEEPIRLVLVVCTSSSIGPEFAARVKRQNPKLVLLCADYFKVSSFESVVRLDMEVIDYLNVPCVWVIVKSGIQRKSKTTNIITEEEVKAANHFLSSARKSIWITLMGSSHNGQMRKLGSWLYESVCRSENLRSANRERRNRPRRKLARSFSLLCLFTKPTERRRSSRDSFLGLKRWLR